MRPNPVNELMEMTSKNIGLTIVGIFLIVGGAYAFAVWWLNPRPLPEVVACVNALPNAKSIGIDFEIKNKSDVTAKFGQSITPGTREAKDAVAIIDAMSRCIRDAHGTLRLDGAAIIPEEQPIGAILNIWQSEKTGAVGTFSLSAENDRKICA